MPTLGAPLDFATYEARSVRAHQLGTAPGSPVTGQLYYNTADNTLYWWDGSQWVSARGGAQATPPATTGALGTIQLAGDLAGTATSPQIAAGVITDAEVAAANKDGAVGTASMRTLGTGATQAAPGNDARFTDARTPTGAAGGDLTGTYPSPQIAPGVITDGDVAAANKDGTAGTLSLRTLGTGATQAAAGNDARFSDARTPTGAASGDLSGTYPSPQIAAGVIVDADVAAANKDGLVAVPSLRTIGTGAQQAMAGNTRLDTIAAPTGPVSLNNQRITGLAAPASATDAATMGYVDGVAQGLEVKLACRSASTANVTLATPGATIDGVTMVAGDRVLLKDQSTASQNGIYIWNGAASAMTRAPDANTSAEMAPGSFTFIEEGTINADSGWVLTTNAPITLDTTPLAFSQFSGAGQITAGNGLTKSGNTIDAVGTTNRITVAADAIDIAATYVGQTSITTLGTIGTGTWNGSAIPVANGGTGQTTAKAARETGMGAAGYYSSATHGAGATISITQATHGLRASRGLIVQCQVEATGAVILPDMSVAANGDVTVTFGASQTANTIRVTVIG